MLFSGRQRYQIYRRYLFPGVFAGSLIDASVIDGSLVEESCRNSLVNEVQYITLEKTSVRTIG
eukprot:scaffold13679_cov54-Attheya_sp.AAC.2